MTITRKQAMELIEAAVDYAERHSYMVSAAVVDEGGNEIATVRMDGAKFLSPSIARAKAVTSSAFRNNSAKVEGSTESKTVFYTGVSLIRSGELAIGQGACPVWEDDELIGALGVSGLAPERDEEVVLSALSVCGYPTSPSDKAALSAQGFSGPVPSGGPGS